MYCAAICHDILNLDVFLLVVSLLLLCLGLSDTVSRPRYVAGDFSDVLSSFPTGRNRSMSWLLAAVMSVCEEDPRKCRSLRRGRLQRLRAGGGGGIVLDDADLAALSGPLLNNDDPSLPVKR